METEITTYAYIDASNLFYGGKKSLGWSIDYEKLIQYLKYRFGVSKVYYFGGVETYGFPFDYLSNDTVCLDDLEKYLIEYTGRDESNCNTEYFNKSIKQVRFYKKIEKFGYELFLKPVKIYFDEFGNKKRKANCDVEMAFNLTYHRDLYDRVIVLSGDGDFLSVLKHLRNKDNKEVFVLAYGTKTAKEIKRFAGDMFIDITNLKDVVAKEVKLEKQRTAPFL
jgi:uncharacterized LabA/DUF88 family protein